MRKLLWFLCVCATRLHRVVIWHSKMTQGCLRAIQEEEEEEATSNDAAGAQSKRGRRKMKQPARQRAQLSLLAFKAQPPLPQLLAPLHPNRLSCSLGHRSSCRCCRRRMDCGVHSP